MKYYTYPNWLFYLCGAILVFEWLLGASIFAVGNSKIAEGVNYGIPIPFEVMLQRLFILVFLFASPVLVFLHGLKERQEASK
jgi:hypothetical protein